MTLKKIEDHNVLDAECGSVHQILQGTDYPSASAAIVPNIKETGVHYHKTFDEIYFLLDGDLSILLHDPAKGKSQRETLKANKLCVIPSGIHHKVIESTDSNCLSAICVPAFKNDDVHASTLI